MCSSEFVAGTRVFSPDTRFASPLPDTRCCRRVETDEMQRPGLRLLDVAARTPQPLNEWRRVPHDLDAIHGGPGAVERIQPLRDPYAPAGEYHHVLAGDLNVGQDMGRQQNGLAGTRRQQPDASQHRFALFGIQSGRRLVEDQQRRVMDDSLGELQLLPHARRIGIDVAVTFLLDAAEIQDLVRSPQAPPRRESRRAARQTAASPRRSSRADNSHPPAYSRLAPDRADLRAELAAQNASRALADTHQSEDHLDQRRFARAVRPQQTRDARANAQRHVVQRASRP